MQQRTAPAPATAAEETLDLAMLNSGIIALFATFTLVAYAGFTSLPALAGLIVGDLLLVFLITPHLVARWLDRDIDDLLDPSSTADPAGNIDPEA